MNTDDLDFDLPADLIAQEPPPQRTASRLMRYRRADRSVAHHTFSDLPRLLRPGDLLVFNDARVIPARFALRKHTGGRVEGLFLREPQPGRWRVMLRNLGPVRGPSPPLTFEGEPALSASVAWAGEGGEYELLVSTAEPAVDVLGRVGRMPLPPYIRR